MGVLTDVMAGLLTLFVTMALFRLFREVDRDLSPSLTSRASGVVFPPQLGEIVAMSWLALGRLPPDSRLAAEHWSGTRAHR